MHGLSVWRCLAACFMRLGGWKGVDLLAKPRLKNIEVYTSMSWYKPCKKNT
jgi:hypothetical protein